MTINTSKFAHIRPPFPIKRKGKDAFDPNLKIPKDYQFISKEIRSLEEELNRFILSKDDYFELIMDAYSSNVHYSTEMEGNPLGLDEVKRITRNSFRGIIEPEPTGPRQEILNHLSTWIFPKLFEFPWSIEKISGIHDMIMDFDPGSKPGQFRNKNDKGEFSVGYGDEIYFIPAPGFRVHMEMEWLVDWVNDYSLGYDPIIGASVMFHEFESIHPFYDGNGRIGRTLFHAYLQCAGLPNSSLCKIEQHLAQDRRLYYDILAWTDDKLEYTDLIDYMSEAILESYREAVQIFSSKDLLSKDLGEPAKRLLIRAKKEKDWFKISEALNWADGLSYGSVRNYLNELVDIGALDTQGRTKGKLYKFANPLEEIQDNIRNAMDEKG